MGFFDDLWTGISDVFDWMLEVTLTPIDWISDLFMPEDVNLPIKKSEIQDRVGNTISEGIFVSRCYGKCKIGGNKIRFNAGTDSDLRIIIGHCIGPVEGITRWEVNDVEWSELSGSHTKTEYTGTRTQTVDARFSTLPSAYRNIAYTACTFVKDDKQVGYNPTITVVMEGLLCAPLAGGADAFTRNSAVILYDWYLNVEGYTTDDLDLNAFKSLEALCDEVPSGSSLPRYRFDYNIDKNMTINDAKKLIWSSFNGRTIMSQGKIKPIWDSAQMEDGSGGLTAKTISHAFDLDNIVKGSFKWGQLERPNVVRIYFRDSEENYKTSSVEIKDEADIIKNGEILFEEECIYITDAEIARRRAKFKYNKKRYPDYSCSFTAMSGAGDIELLDLVTVTHVLPGWTTKQFIITSRGEDEIGRMKFSAEAYYSGAYDDSQVGTQANYGSDLPNPFVPVSISDLALEEGGFIAGDGSYVPYVTLTFTKPSNPFWFRGQVFVSTDGGSNYTFYQNTTTGSGFRIDAAKAKFSEGDTLYVKVLSENNNGVVQSISDVSAQSELIEGKTAKPSDITDFSVIQLGNVVLFSCSRPALGTDADFSHFEVRNGASWATALPIVKYTQTKYPLTEFSAGAKIFKIKAFDTSGNESDNEDTVNITLVKPTNQNIFYNYENIRRIYNGTPSQIARNYVFDSAGGFFIAGTETMDDNPGEAMDDSVTDRMWTPAYGTGYIETEAIDAGEQVSGKIYASIETTTYDGASYAIEYKTSLDDITYTAYANFSDGTTAIFRYIIFKITLTVNTGSYPESNIKISSIDITFDLPSITNSGDANTVISAGGTTITFDTAYTTLESIKITMNVISSSALLPTHESKTKTNFIAHVFDLNGDDVGGIIDWKSEGF